MFEQLAAENGYEKLSMICADSNPAIYLYERLGYQKENALLGTRQETKKGSL